MTAAEKNHHSEIKIMTWCVAHASIILYTQINSYRIKLYDTTVLYGQMHRCIYMYLKSFVPEYCLGPS